MTATSVPCPYDGEQLPLEITFLGDPPSLNIDAPELVAHMREHHGIR